MLSVGMGIYPCGVDETYGMGLSLYNRNAFDLFVEARFSIPDPDISNSTSGQLYSECILGIADFVSLSQLLNENSNVLPNDNL